MNFNVTDKQAYYLREYAALQFPGSVENVSTCKPIHCLQQRTDAKMLIQMDDVESFINDDTPLVIENNRWGESYSCFEDLVLDALDSGLYEGASAEARERIINELNEERNLKGLPPFVSYADREKLSHWMDENEEKSRYYDSEIHSYESYLRFYGVDLDDIAIYAYQDGWDDMVFSFIKQEIEPVEASLSNHIFRPTRTFSFSGSSFDRSAADFHPLMDFMMSCGEALLQEDAARLTFEQDVLLSKEEMIEEYTKHPEEPFVAATFCVNNEAGECISTIMVIAKGSMRDCGNVRYPVASIHIEATRFLRENAAENGTRLFRYPFECDGLCENLHENHRVDVFTPMQRLFFYTEYKNTQSQKNK